MEYKGYYKNGYSNCPCPDIDAMMECREYQPTPVTLICIFGRDDEDACYRYPERLLIARKHKESLIREVREELERKGL